MDIDEQGTFNKYFDAQLWFIGWDIKNIYEDFLSFDFTRIPKFEIGTSRYVHTYKKTRFDLWGWGICVRDYQENLSFLYRRHKGVYKIEDLSVFTKNINQPDEIKTSEIEKYNHLLISDFLLKYENHIISIHGNDFREKVSNKEKWNQSHFDLSNFWKDINEKSIHIN